MPELNDRVRCEAIALRFEEPKIGSHTLVRFSIWLGTVCDIGYYCETQDDNSGTVKIFFGVYRPPGECIQLVPPSPFTMSVLVTSQTVIDKVEIYIGEDLVCETSVYGENLLKK